MQGPTPCGHAVARHYFARVTSANEAEQTAARAAELAAKVKPVNYEHVQALALLSIAQSFARIAVALETRDST